MLSASLLLASALSAPLPQQEPQDFRHIGCAHGAMLPAYDETSGLYATLAPAQWPDRKGVQGNPEETNLTNIYQMTFGGQNAEAYWSVDGQSIIYQSLQPGYPDEQIFIMASDGSSRRLVSTGTGRCTCSYLSPDLKYIYFSSTHERNAGPQKKLDMSKGYLWMVNPDFALYRVEAAPFIKGTVKNVKYQPVIKKDGYIAETTISPDGKYMTFTGNFEGDLEIYRSDLNGRNIKKLTDEIGYDGGPFVSWDGKKIVYRRAPAVTPETEKEYRDLLAENLVRPGKLEIWIMDADGKNKKQVTNLGSASFAPFLHPDGKRIIFSTNYGDPRGREFDLWMINVDGTGLKQITKTPDFDGFPMFSRDGKKLVWASNRYGAVRGETNVFVADWKD